MAGNYMDAPASRLAYDRDGSIGVIITATGTITALTGTQLQALNNESETGVGFSSRNRLALIFSYPVDIESIFLALDSSAVTWTIETSKDTTTGLDGTWTTQVAAGPNYLKDVKPNYRILAQLTSMLASTVSDEIRGLRISTPSNSTASVRALHVYGDFSPTATEERVAFWEPVTDQEVGPAHFDWGNVPRGSSADKTFRIKNLSDTLTANDIELYVEALTAGTPSVGSMFVFSDNGGATFLSSLSLGDLLPGAISPVITIRRVVPPNAQISVWSARIAADVTQWTE